MGGKIEFSGQVLLEKQWLDMSLEQVVTDVTADCLTMVFECVEVAVAHFRGDLVGNMKKLPDIAVVSGTALIVFDCLHQIVTRPLGNDIRGRQLRPVYVDDRMVRTAELIEALTGALIDRNHHGLSIAA